ncbi:MAG TPA: YitT family protein [Syntrophomonadaceae bacterium]|jgi:uncharacterized membrane-anchored protein YitT (DUF2179 family)|nr:YitT family protein [Syntrophomonadaceae bacterium]
MNKTMDNMVYQMKRFKEKISLRDILGILLGCFITAAGIQLVLIPAHLLTGGITGMAMIMKFLTDVDVWVWYLLLNIPIFAAGYRFVSTRFAFYSLIGTLSLTFFLGIAKSWTINLGIEDMLLSAILGGVIVGIGSGINLLSKGSAGGLDIIAVIIRRYRGYNIGTVSFMVNLLILLLFLLMANIELMLFSAISIFVTGRVTDAIQLGFGASKTAMVVSAKNEDIAYEIIHNLYRGCTYLTGYGAYSGEDKNILMVTVGKTQVPRLKEIVFTLDPGAFITISDTTEVYGAGFKSSAADF